jgi:hypothetical protein
MVLQPKLNPLTQRKPPPMRAQTRRFLNDYFLHAGLSEMLGVDLDRFWSWNE